MVRAARLETDAIRYFAFPWATLIDRMASRHADEQPLLDALVKMSKTARRAPRVVTVCQHIRMLEFRHLFEMARVTDVFWSHAIKGRPRWGGNRPINLHPFPLYPVQSPVVQTFSDAERRPLLFNFIGAVENSWYLTDVRQWIARHLAREPNGSVILRRGWHYQRAVYEHQVKGLAPDGEPLTDAEAEAEFARALKRSTFTLCPSGSGPNSIRLWEAIGHGSIPVILSDTLALPGPEELWREAAVFCEETEAAVSQLPARLAELAADPVAIAHRRRALRQLWSLYGPLNFAHDIRSLALREATPEPAPAPAFNTVRRPRICLFGRHANRTPFAYPPYRALLEDAIDYVEDPAVADAVILGFEIDIRDSFEVLARLKADRPQLLLAVVSEEPLWDTVWSHSLTPSRAVLSRNGETLEFARVNHANSDVFDFDAIPYFLTTDDAYFVRYGAWFCRNAWRPGSHYLKVWERAPVRVAFMAEKRDKKVYDIQHPEARVWGLSAYRTAVAQGVVGPDVLRAGRGWDDADFRRQDLVDWRLDKMARLDGQAFMVSAMENTHHRQYVTEKLFDAYAARAFPLYVASPGHRVFDLAGDSFLNLHGLTPGEAVAKIEALSPDQVCLDSYVATQHRLADLFRRPALLAHERRRVARKVREALSQHLDLSQAEQPAMSDATPMAMPG